MRLARLNRAQCLVYDFLVYGGQLFPGAGEKAGYHGKAVGDGGCAGGLEEQRPFFPGEAIIAHRLHPPPGNGPDQ